MIIYYKYGFIVFFEFKCWICIKIKLIVYFICRIGFYGNWDVILNIVVFNINY